MFTSDTKTLELKNVKTIYLLADGKQIHSLILKPNAEIFVTLEVGQKTEE